MIQRGGVMKRHGFGSRSAAVAVLAAALGAILVAAPVATPSTPPRGAKGPLIGGKLYHGTVLDKGPLYKKNYYFYVRRATRITATFTNTTPDIDGDLQTFSVDFLNAAGDVITFPSLESLFPQRTEKLSRRLRPGTYYLQLNGISDRCTYTFRLDPVRAIGRRSPGSR